MNEKFTVEEMAQLYDMLIWGKVGDYAETEDKKIEIVNMNGGRYLCFIKEFDRWWVVKVTNNIGFCIDFIEG